MTNTEFNAGTQEQAEALAKATNGVAIYDETSEEWQVCDETGEWHLFSTDATTNSDPDRPSDAPEGWEWTYVA